MSVKSVCLLISFIVLASSMLVTRKQAEKLNAETAHLLHPEYAQPDYVAASGSSSANPVQGIANATSGYLSISQNTDAALFYVFYSCRGLNPLQQPNQVPIVVWLQGGPGASSQMGNFFELGPY